MGVAGATGPGRQSIQEGNGYNDDMAKVVIRTEFPTPEEVAAYHKIPPARVAELRQMMEDLSIKRKTAATSKIPPDGIGKRAPKKK
jgi:hypothetical protein